MDQIPRSNDANCNLFDSQQYHAYDSSFLNSANSNFQDASWCLNAGGYDSGQSRGQNSVPSWPQHANNLSTVSGSGNNFNDQRSLSHSPAPFGQNAFGGYPPQQSFQSYQQPQYDHTLYNPSYGSQPQQLGTIAPQALQHERHSPLPTANAYGGVPFAQNTTTQQRMSNASTPSNVDQHALLAAIPKGIDNGYLSTINFDQLAGATNSERMSNYLNVSRVAQEWPVNRTTTLPQYVSRKSKNELRKLAGNDRILLAKIGKKSLKKERAIGASLGLASGTTISKGPGSLEEKIKYEGETSSSEESDDDDSSYTSEEDLEGSPMPTTRPDSPKGGVEYDTIKALWRPKRKSLSGEDIRKGLVDFWEITKTIRDRWKKDTAAVTEEAEGKNRKGELDLLRSRVKDQRDMVEAAFKAALKHGHRSIIELMGENHSLVFLCYQFLLDRFKDDDANSPLSRVILELMTLCTTLSDTTLEKVHLDKVLPRYIKKGDAKTQYFAKRIMANAAAAVTTSRAPTSQPSKPAAAVKAGNAASPPVRRSEPETLAGVKRSANNAGEGGATKKVATATARPNGIAAAAKPTRVMKRPATGTNSSKPAVTAVTAPKTKQVTAKPSSFFSSLQSAAKKPGTSIKAGIPAQAAGVKPAEKKPVPTTSAVPKPTFSFSETMANLSKPNEEKLAATKPEKQLPPETLEEKAKRLRKEARRKLHVAFKLGDDLVQVRYFTHDPEEEMGHDDSQMRDVSDVGGEGRMLKLHADQMEVDDEDDGEEDQKLIDFVEPSPIDFSVIHDEERNRNYVQCGGKLEPVSAERAAREQYEANTLIVFYTEERDIPPNPREPADPYNGETTSGAKQFGAPEEKFATRARHWKATRPQQQYQHPAQQQAPVQQPPFDMSALNQFVSHQQQPAAQQTQAAGLDIQKLLASLQPSFQQQQPQAPPLMGFGGAAPAPAPSTNEYQPPQPNGQQIDLSAILAAIGGQPSGAAQAPQMVGGFGGYQPQMQQPPMGGQYDGSNDRRYRNQGENYKPYKTKVCKYWQEGKCTKGDGCTYLHEEPSA